VPIEIDLLPLENATVTAPAGCGKTELIADALRRHTGPKPILVHRHIHKIQGPPSLGQADHRNRRGFIVGLTNGSEPPLYLLSESVH
jgi:hypothetical protein